MHVLMFPILIGMLLTAHLALVALRHHTQFKQRARDGAHRRRRAGVPGSGAAVARPLLRGRRRAAPAGRPRADQPDLAVGPVPHRTTSTNGAQPDWYLGWLIGALRLVPGFDVMVGHYTLIPNPFWGGVALPDDRDRLPLLLAVGSSASTGDHGVPQPARASARQSAAHGASASRWSRGSSSSSSPARPTASTCCSTSRTTSRSGSTASLVFVGPVVAGVVAARVCKSLQRGEVVERERAEPRQTPGCRQ